MESIEVSAKSVEEAVEEALARLGLDRSQVQIEVLSKGRAGLLGIGAEEARVRVSPLPPPQAPPPTEVAQAAQEALEHILRALGLRARVEGSLEPADQGSTVLLNVVGQDLGILIGRRGETLGSLQYLVNLIVSRRFKAPAGVIVDVEGYRRRRLEALEALARRVAEQVKATGHSETLEPMPARERRIVHLTLRDDPDVATQSLGEGESRKVAIFLKKGPLTSDR